MRSQGSAPELERRRELAVARVNEGYSQAEVASFLGVYPNTVSRRVCTARQQGACALKSRPVPSRRRKLNVQQERTVLGRVAKPPTRFGFATDLWTSQRLATLIEQRLGVRFNSNNLVEWLRAREQSPQEFDRPARERDEAEIARWKDEDLPHPASSLISDVRLGLGGLGRSFALRRPHFRLKVSSLRPSRAHQGAKRVDPLAFDAGRQTPQRPR